MTKLELKRRLKKETGGCVIQHDGWPCGTCFGTVLNKYNAPENLHSDIWQSLLVYRGDYKLGEYVQLTQEQVDANIKILKDLLTKSKAVK